MELMSYNDLFHVLIALPRGERT